MKRYILALLVSVSLPLGAMERTEDDEGSVSSLCEYLGRQIMDRASSSLADAQRFVHETGVQAQRAQTATLEYLAMFILDEKVSAQRKFAAEKNDQNAALEQLRAENQQQLATIAEREERIARLEEQAASLVTAASILQQDRQ